MCSRVFNVETGSGSRKIQAGHRERRVDTENTENTENTERKKRKYTLYALRLPE